MRPHRGILLLAVTTLVVAVAACDGASGPTGDASASPDASITAPSASSEVPSASAEPSFPEPSDEPTEEPTDEPSDEPGASATTGPAAECSGSEDNRKFYASVAVSAAWDVYCPVLPAGWFVDSGEWRAAGGGRMEIAYKGPGGARFELHEGAFCAAGSSCVPDGSEAGTAAFGDLEGTLVATSDGGWAVSVGTGEAISYLAVGTGLGQDAFLAAAANLIVVAD